MTVKNIMTSRLIKLKPTDRVCDALEIMHKHQIRNLPVVDDNGQFVGLFGIRGLVRLLLPKAGKIKLGLKDLSFMPDEPDQLNKRLAKEALKPVSDFLEKRKNLIFCKPSTSFPEVLELLEHNPDTSMPVIIVKGKRKKLVGMVSAWDVLEKLVMNAFVAGNDTSKSNPCAELTNAGENTDEDAPVQ